MGYNATLIWTHFLKKKYFSLQKICCKKNYLLKEEKRMKLILRWKDPVPKFYQIIWPTWYTVNQRASQVVWVVKNPPASTGDMRDVGSIPGLGRSPGGGLGNPLQYSCLKNSTDRASRPATVQRLANSLFTHMHTSTNQSKQCFLKQPLNPLQCYISMDSRHWEEKRQILSSLSSDSHCSQTDRT